MTVRKAYKKAMRQRLLMKKAVIIMALISLLAIYFERASTSAPMPMMVGSKLMVDHKIIVPAGGILLSNGKARGSK